MAPARTGASSGALVSAPFAGSLPLFLGAALLFALGLTVLDFDPRYGAGPFTVWLLLLLLGCIAAGGGIVAWLLVEEPASPGAQPRGTRTDVSATSEGPARTPAPASDVDRADFGRPIPTVHEWSEEPYSHPDRFSATVSPVEQPDWDEGPATPSLDRLPGRLSAAEALRDLDGIERELAPRVSSPSQAPTTA
jgi:hypothetical protein